jgi:hypothetical protein
MYLSVVDWNNVAHFIDHKTKFTCVTVCGDDIEITKNNFISFDDEIPNLCNSCKQYQRLITGKTDHPLSRTINNQNLIIKGQCKNDTQNQADQKYKPIFDRHWKILIKFKHYYNR